MRAARTTNVLLVLALVTITAVPGCGWQAFKARRSVSMTAIHMSDSPIVVTTRNGGVSVIADTTVDGVIIEAVLTCSGASQAEADDRLAQARLDVSRDLSRTLHIEPVFPPRPGSFGSGDGASITVRLPDAREITVKTGNGHIELHGLSGSALANTSNGKIIIENHDGPVEARTSNGGVRIVNVSGTVLASSSNGGITIDSADGPVTVDTSNGKIRVTLADHQAGPVNADTSNGSIVLSVGPAFAGDVKMDTSNSRATLDDRAGRVTYADLRKRSGRVRVGDGGPDSSLDTSNGKVTLTIRGD